MFFCPLTSWVDAVQSVKYLRTDFLQDFHHSTNKWSDLQSFDFLIHPQVGEAGTVQVPMAHPCPQHTLDLTSKSLLE